MHSPWKLSWKVIFIVLSFFLLAACGGPDKPGPVGPEPGPTEPGPQEPTEPEPVEPTPAPVGAISGVLEDWNAQKGTYVHFTSFGDGSTPQYFSSAISGGGEFSVELSEPSLEQLVTTTFCNDVEESPEFRAATISQGIASSQADPQADAETGRIFLGSNPEFFFGDSTKASVGDRRTEWWYSDEEVAFSGECEDIFYTVKFEKGWNLYHTIVTEVTADSVVVRVETSPVPEDASWTFYTDDGF